MTERRLLDGYVAALLVAGGGAFCYGAYLSFVAGANGVEVGLLGTCLLFLAVPTRIFAGRGLPLDQQLQVIAASTLVVVLAAGVFLVADSSAPQFGLAIALGMLALVAAQR